MNANATGRSRCATFGAGRKGNGGSRNGNARAALPLMEAVERRVMCNAAPVGGEFLVNSTTAGDQLTSSLQRSVASDAAGNFTAVWQSNGQDGSGAGVYARRFNAAGEAQGAEFRVNSFTAGDQKTPTIAMDPGGNFVVAWDSVGQDGGADGVYAQRYSAAGAPVGGEFRVNAVTAGAQLQPSVATGSGGGFVIAWASDQDPRAKKETVNYGIYAQRYDAAGVPQGGAFHASTTVAGAQIQPSVTVTAAGQFVIAWAGAGAGDTDGVFAQRFDAQGLKLGGEFRVNNYTTLGQGTPSIASDANGNFVVAYTSYSQDGDSGGIYARRYSAAGAALEPAEFRVNSKTVAEQAYGQVAMDADGSFVVTWEDQTGDASGFGVYGQQYDPAGAPVGSNFLVNTFTAGDQVHPSVALQPGGGFVIVWTSGQEDGSGWGVFAQLFQPA